jgi:hypothetical protein
LSVTFFVVLLTIVFKKCFVPLFLLIAHWLNLPGQIKDVIELHS